jgi:hypothetical protein
LNYINVVSIDIYFIHNNLKRLEVKRMAKMQKKSINNPEETRSFTNGKIDLVTLDDVTFGLATFNPGWQWSKNVKPIVKTESCLAPHTNYHISGTLHVKMDDGQEMEFGPGDIGLIPPGHDAWTVGEKPAVVLDITGMMDYAKEE